MKKRGLAANTPASVTTGGNKTPKDKGPWGREKQRLGEQVRKTIADMNSKGKNGIEQTQHKKSFTTVVKR